MDAFVGKFERYISYTLVIIGMMFIVYQTFDLIYEFGELLWQSAREKTFYASREGRPVAGLFFSILLTLEIIQTVRVFSKDHEVKIRIIMLVGLIAVTRKILMMDMTEAKPMEEFSVAALVVALALGYFLVSRSSKLSSASNDTEN